MVLILYLAQLHRLVVVMAVEETAVLVRH